MSGPLDILALAVVVGLFVAAGLTELLLHFARKNAAAQAKAHAAKARPSALPSVRLVGKR